MSVIFTLCLLGFIRITLTVNSVGNIAKFWKKCLTKWSMYTWNEYIRRMTYIHIYSMYKIFWVWFTFVLFINWSQCLSRMAGFWSSPTALREVRVFLTVASNPMYVSQVLISLSNILISFANFLHSMSIFSTSIFLQGVVFQSLTHAWTIWT